MSRVNGQHNQDGNYDLLCFLLGTNCKNGTIVELHNHLFNRYMKEVRPVLNHSTVTNVTYRLIVRSLLEVVCLMWFISFFLLDNYYHFLNPPLLRNHPPWFVALFVYFVFFILPFLCSLFDVFWTFFPLSFCCFFSLCFVFFEILFSFLLSNKLFNKKFKNTLK